MYEGSDAAWKPNRCAPIAMIAVAALATRDGSMEVRVNSTYAAACIDAFRGCSAGVTPIASASKSNASFSLRATSPK